MQRRELFRLLAAGAALPVFNSNLLAAFQDAHPKSTYTLRTLNPHQNATVVTITDLIIPETDTPGAKAVRVNEFIDLILTDWAHEDERQKFLSGLESIDKRSNAHNEPREPQPLRDVASLDLLGRRIALVQVAGCSEPRDQVEVDARAL